MDTIKVHVTESQREMLQFLVERRIRDIYRGVNQRNQNTETAQAILNSDPELATLNELKIELRHAGT